MSLQWSNDRVADRFRSELRARFEAHNAAYRAREAVELEKVLQEHPAHRGQPGFEAHDSIAWEVYQACEIQIVSNHVTIVLPKIWAIGIELVHMFSHTAVAWSLPSIEARIVDGEPRVAIEIMLIDYWDDERDAAWKEEGEDRRHVLVDLREDQVRALDSLLAVHSVPSDEALELRKRFQLALEYLP